jgi:inner membrane protein
MQKSLFTKFIIIAVLAFILLLPLSMIGNVIDDRQYHREAAIQDIVASSTGEQVLTAAILVAPYKEQVIRETEKYEDGKKHTVQKQVTLQKYKYILPEKLVISGNVTTEERYRGIHKVPVYTADLDISGRFHVEKSLGITERLEHITFQKPYIVLGVQDIRGINQSVKLNVDGQAVDLHPGSQTSVIPQGIHGTLNLGYGKDADFDFDMSLALQGMKALSFLPTGKSTQIDLTSPWPHPSFHGRFLPKNRVISEDGFEAAWETSFFASNMPQLLEKCAANSGDCSAFNNNVMGVSLHQGVDIYLQSERSVKYALLFVGLTFVAFFLFEVIKGLRIHAVQYGLVGVALALFYLLLISLSEHIAFGLAYIIAASACVSLISFYVRYVLGSWGRSMLFAGSLAGLYGALYMLIRSEDYALLMGSFLLFAVIGFIMVVTRKIDWYKIEADTVDHLSKPFEANTDKASSSPHS